MTIRVQLVAALLCGLCACTSTSHDPPAPTDQPASAAPPAATVMEVAATDDEAAPPMVISRAMIAPSPEMLKAALQNDPDAMRDAVVATAGTCHASNTCPGQFGSCGTWSTPSLCSQTCGGPLCRCKPVIDCMGELPEPRGTDTFNSFRVCFDANQNGCTEWSSTVNTYCGC